MNIGDYCVVKNYRDSSVFRIKARHGDQLTLESWEPPKGWCYAGIAYLGSFKKPTRSQLKKAGLGSDVGE